MKNIHYLGIIIILIAIAGLFIISPFSPLNKASIDGHTVNLPSGYTVKNSTETNLQLTNGSNIIYIFSHKQKSVPEAVTSYKKYCNNSYNLTEDEITINEEKIVRTSAKKLDNNKIIYRYWFTKDNKVFSVQTHNKQPETEEIVQSLISSI